MADPDPSFVHRWLVAVPYFQKADAMMFWIAAAIVTALCVAKFWLVLFAQKPVTRTTKIIALLILVLTPLIALGLYYEKGSIGMPDFPIDRFVSKREQANEALLLNERPLIRQLREHPQNEKLWLELITLYLQTNRPEQAMQAYEDARQSVQKPVLLNNPALRKLAKPQN